MDNRIDCVMLAAGESMRMGQWKMILPYRNTTIVEQSVSNALEVCNRVILVTGHRAVEIEELFAGRDRIVTVRNNEYSHGMFSSIRVGAAEVTSSSYFISLGDMPLVSPEIYRYLLTFSKNDAVIPKFHGKKGHPVLLSERTRSFLLSLSPDETLRTVIAEFPSLAVPVTEKGILTDIDTPEDYSNLS